jgi:hypothetical protein
MGVPVSHGGSIGRYNTMKMHSVLLAGEMSSEMVYLPYVSLDVATIQTSLCIFIVLFKPTVFDGSVQTIFVSHQNITSKYGIIKMQDIIPSTILVQ